VPDFVGSADGNDLAILQHSDAMGNAECQIAIMRYHQRRGMNPLV
jgi:hypothetical protein